MEGKSFTTIIQEWDHTTRAQGSRERIKALQEIFYDIGLQTSPICVIGSRKTISFRTFKEKHPDMCFNPEKYNITTGFEAGKIRIAHNTMNLINASFIKGVIDSKRSVVCCAYLGHSSYVDKAKKTDPNLLSDGTFGEIVLLLAGGYTYTPATSQVDFNNDDIKNSLNELNGYNTGNETKLFGVFRYNTEKGTRLGQEKIQSFLKYGEMGPILEEVRGICLNESNRLTEQ